MIRKIQVEYFRPSGKFYTESELEFEDGTEPLTKSGMPTVANMYAIRKHIIELQEQGNLPGLTKGSKWENGTIWFNSEDGYPCIIVPETAQQAMDVDM